MLLGHPSCWCLPARMSATNLAPSCLSSLVVGADSMVDSSCLLGTMLVLPALQEREGGRGLELTVEAFANLSLL